LPVNLTDPQAQFAEPMAAGKTESMKVSSNFSPSWLVAQSLRRMTASAQ
jgi:hypothetical protein